MTETQAALQRCARELLARCDGALTTDGRGFSRYDRALGERLVKSRYWSPNLTFTAYRMLRKYRKQLLNYGIDFTVIDAPPEPDRPTFSVIGSDLIANSEVKGSVRLTSSKNFFLTFERDERVGKRVLDIPRREWKADYHGWFITATLENFQPLLSLVIDYDFYIEPGVLDRIEEVTAEMAANITASQSERADIEIEGLGGRELGYALRDYQKAGVAYCAPKETGYIADDMGLGKSPTALGIIAYTKSFPAVVVCPASVKYKWAKEVLNWLPGKTVSVIEGLSLSPSKPLQISTWYGDKCASVNDLSADVLIVNFDLLRYSKKKPSPLVEGIKARKNKILIIDEAHNVSNGDAQRSKAVYDISKKAKRVYCLSGTPFKNRHIELLHQLKILRMIGKDKPFGTERDYRWRFCDPQRNRFALGGYSFDGSTNGEALNELLRANVMIRRRKEDVLKELPPYQYTEVPFELTNRAEYKRAEKEPASYIYEQVKRDPELKAEVISLLGYDPFAVDSKIEAIAQDKKRKAEVAEHLVRIALLKKLAAVGKLKGVVEWVKDFPEKLILFAVNKSVQQELLKHFPDAAHILGDDSAKVRHQNNERFQNDPDCKLIICSLQAASEGIDLTASCNVAFVQYGWNDAVMKQAMARSNRIGLNEKQGRAVDFVNVFYLVANHTIEEDMIWLINKKAKITQLATDGDPDKRQDTTVNYQRLKPLACL